MKLYNSQEIFQKIPNTFKERKGERKIVKPLREKKTQHFSFFKFQYSQNIRGESASWHFSKLSIVPRFNYTLNSSKPNFPGSLVRAT